MLHLINILAILAVTQSALAATTTTFDARMGNPCAATWGPTWSDGIVSGYTKCENVDVAIAKPLSYYKSNQIVAIDLNLLNTPEGRAKYWGKKVTKPDGTEHISPGGDLFVWDSCEACMSAPKVDFSAPDQLLMTGATGDKCGVGTAAYKIEILDESVAEYGGHPPNAPGGVDTFAGSLVGGGGAVCVAPGAGGAALAPPAVSSAGSAGVTAVSSPAAGAATAPVDTAASIPATGAVAPVAPVASAAAPLAVVPSSSTAAAVQATSAAGAAAPVEPVLSAPQAVPATSTSASGRHGGGRGSHWGRTLRR